MGSWGKQGSVSNSGELEFFVDHHKQELKIMVKAGERNIGTWVPGTLSGFNLFDKAMAGLDVKMAFAKLQAWASAGAEL